MADDTSGEPGVSDGAATHAGRANIASIARNVASVAAIPWEELPDGPAWGCLLEMAHAGGDVRAFRVADGRWWCVWGAGRNPAPHGQRDSVFDHFVFDHIRRNG